jgi:hypothetical protein
MHGVIHSSIIVILVSALLSGCGAGNKGPAETALKAVEEAVTAAKADASKYLPEQLGSLDAQVAALRDKFSRGDYKAVLTDAPTLTAKAQELASAAAAKKVELTKSWDGLRSGMPRVVEAIRNRVDILSQIKKLPAGMPSETLAQAKAGLNQITEQWNAATEASKGGNLADAVAQASSVKVKAAEVLTLLKMPVPEALKV